ncbi:MAG: hypothetical protein RLZZ440_3101 [Planctomycetota bacterium]
MIAQDSDPSPRRTVASDQPASLAGLPDAARVQPLTLPTGRGFDLLIVPCGGSSAEGSQGQEAVWADAARRWVIAAAGSLPHTADAAGTTPVTIPLYGCHVIWTPSRGAVLGPVERLDQLVAALGDFASREAELRDLEHRGDALLATVEADAPSAFATAEESLGGRPELAARFSEAVAVRRGLATLGPAVHVPPVHPPTLASQLGERLRDRTRLAERHELATDRADFALQIYEACGQRASDVAIARRQMGLEWVIIVILVAQLALMVVEMLSSRSGT